MNSTDVRNIAAELEGVDIQRDQVSAPFSYLRAVTAAGGIPLLIPPSLTREQLAETLARLDGLVLIGGGDLDHRAGRLCGIRPGGSGRRRGAGPAGDRCRGGEPAGWDGRCPCRPGAGRPRAGGVTPPARVRGCRCSPRPEGIP